MIYPTLLIQVLNKDGFDAYSQPRYKSPKFEKVAPVKLHFMQRSTSVRTDAAASKARAQESNAQVVILAKPSTRINLDDKLIVMGHSLRVIDMTPRLTVMGELDHFEVACNSWV